MSSIEERLGKKGLISDEAKDVLKSIDAKLLNKEQTEFKEMKEKFDLFILHGNL